MSRHPNGTGTVVQLADGRYQAKLQVEGRRVSVYGKTRTEAEKKLDDLRRQATAQGGLPSSATVKELLDRWIETEQAKWKPLYRRDVLHFVDDVIVPALGKVRLGQLRPDRIQRFYNDLAKRSSQQAAHCHRILRRGIRVGVQWGYLPVNPLDRVTPPVHKSAVPVLWTPEQVKAFLAGTDGDWLAPFYAVCLHTGCRPGEVLGLHWGDLQGNALRVERTLQRIDGKVIEVAPKSRSGRRTLTVTPALLALFKRQRAQQAEWRLRAGEAWANAPHVFTTKTGGPLSSSTADHHLHLLADRLDLPRLGLHKLRHLSASLALQNGVPLPMVSRRLGHSGVQVTAMVYSHLLTTDQQAADVLAKVLEA